MSLDASNAGGLPPSDRDDAPEAAQREPLTGEELREKLRARMAAGLSQADLARQVGISATTMSRWMVGKYEGDNEKVERALLEWEAHVDEREDLRRELVPTRMAQRVMRVARSIVNTGDFGLMTGEAGIGKTCGLRLFGLENPAAMFLTAAKYRGSGSAILHAIWDLIVLRQSGREYSMRRPDVLRERLLNSNRALIIDDAHYLTTSGFQTVVCLHNDTAIPVILSGNPVIIEMILRLKDEDQYTSRIGQNQKFVSMKEEDARELADILLTQYAPAQKKELFHDAVQVCLKRGHGRRLKKQLWLAVDMLKGGLDERNEAVTALRAQKKTTAQIAFALARAKLLALPEKGEWAA